MNTNSAEFAYIQWIRSQTNPLDPNILLGPGDDCGLIDTSNVSRLLITTDMLLEGSCFILEEAGARAVGRKALSVNLSDIAAMAGVPIAAVISLGLPRKNGQAIAKELYQGMREVGDRFQTTIVGGDTNSWSESLVISVTLLGKATERGEVRRQGACIGDWIMVTGPLGGSISGKHLDFTPRVSEALAIHSRVPIHAMIDISDGLAADLYHICTESQCGAVLVSESIPITQSAYELAQNDGRSPLEHALSDGEDFEVILTVAPKDGEMLLREQPIESIQIHHIGKILAKGYYLESSGIIQPLVPKGYTHLLD